MTKNTDHPSASAAPEVKSDEEIKDLADDQVQEIVDKHNAQGFTGVEVDQTPNEHYTVPGQVAGKPVPETDADQAKKARGES